MSAFTLHGREIARPSSLWARILSGAVIVLASDLIQLLLRTVQSDYSENEIFA